ncbi:MAG: COR domain-containing protein, partial [Bacteroidota bacterium]
MTANELIELEKEQRTGYLDIGRCGLTELPDLSDLHWLETLIVSNRWWDWEQRKWVGSQNSMAPNQLNASPSYSLPPGIKRLVFGGDLINGKWQVSDCRFLENLSGITSLYLSDNQIIDGCCLEKLTTLTSLYLSRNKISDWHFLEKLTNLTALDLTNNQISDWRFLEKLTNLTALDLTNNQISNGHFLEKLTNLSTLDLRKNKISDGRFLEKFTNLSTLDLSHNNISDLTPLLPLIKKGVPVTIWRFGDGINLRNNPLARPPEAVVSQGNEAILDYFRQKEKTGSNLLLEAKLILLGDGRAGKTTLANRMLDKPLPTEAQRTLGVDINIGEYRFPVAEGREFKLHIWDFAGQDKYKPLHQFFYTEGAVYVMVADSGNAGTDYDDWLQTAELFGEGSPLVMALNEFREGIGYGAFDEEHWRKRFPKLLKEVRLVNLLTRQGFPQLEKDIRHFAETLPHTQAEYPKNWAAIRRELERRREENFIPFGEYLKICRENDLPEKASALILSGVLHKIGVCLHYQKNEILRQHVILKNEWATGAVYKILEDRRVAEEKKGFFDGEDLKRIWSDEAECEMRPQLLELMQQFKMAYPLPNGKEYVAPPLLPPAPPAGWAL